jgi:glycerol-3-phosphate dehydrogenase
VADTRVAIIGGGVVGAAVAFTLARRGVACVLLEAQADYGRAASGMNSGILHTGFDSPPGELETRLILRAAELREQVLPELDVPVQRCGALLRPHDSGEAETVRAVAAAAQENGVEVNLDGDGVLHVPGESITDPVGFVHALVAAAEAAGAQARTRARVERIARLDDALVLVRSRRELRRTARGHDRAHGRRRQLHDLSAQGRVLRVRPA